MKLILENIKEFTGSEKSILPISRYVTKEYYQTLYDRIDMLYHKGKDILSPEDYEQVKYISRLLMDSIMFYNYQFSSSNSVGKDIENNIKRKKALDKLIRKGKI